MKFSVSDTLVTGAVIALSCGLLYLFILDMNTVTGRSGQAVLGTVVFKKLSATRHPVDGLSWERMHNNGPVFDSDTLRTADSSEAAIYFEDGTSLDLGENTMLKLSFGGPVKSLEFLEGEITVGGSASESNYSISSRAGSITVGKDSLATFSRDKDTVSVEVSRGEATLVAANGSTQTIAQKQELAVSLSDGKATFVSRPIVPLKPERNARLLDLKTARSDAPAELDFAWQNGKADGAGESSPEFTVEISSVKNFTQDLSEFSVTGLSARIPVMQGSWYWRVRDASGKESPAHRFSLTGASPPVPAFPPDRSEYHYRKIKPEVLFAWTGMEEASAYLFELALEPSFDKPYLKTRVSATSFSVSDLGEGLWYWRVKPVHGFTEISSSPAIECRSFKIAKSGMMKSLDVSTPFAGLLYQIQELDGKGISFAWIPQTEAVSYELSLSSPGLSAPILTIPSTTPYIRLVGAQCGPLLKSGVWNWTVRWIDKEGNRSPESAVRRLNGVDGSIAIRAVFPPDGYRIADSLASNTRFSWKSNIAARTTFVVSRSADFSEPVYQETVTAETLLGKAWLPGDYFWKIRTMNIDGSVFMETSARSFAIVNPLPGPLLLKPSSGVQFYLRERDALTIVWDPVPGADYYTLGIYSPADNYASPVFERGFLEKTEISYPLGNLPGGKYLVRIQGLAAESDMSTRIIGYIGESELAYRQLTYLALQNPENGSVISGLEARRKGVTLMYRTDNVPDEQKFILFKGNPGGSEFARASGRGNTYVQKKLPPGRYYWTVTGTLVGFDISAKETRSFDVLPIPLLPRAELLEPVPDTVIGPVQLRTSRTISFRWNPVEGASQYLLSISKQGSGMPVLVENRTEGTQLILKDLAPLAKGTFVWKLEALSYDSDGELEQSGTPVESFFSIDLPAVKKARATNGDQLYGR